MNHSRKRLIPEVRDPALEHSLVRDVSSSSNASRDETVQSTEGEPPVDFDGKSNRLF
jgi:tryptophan 2,3-dioxygenase